MPASYRFSVGPWNLGRGADPFGPPVRPAMPFDAVLDTAVSLGFEGIQFHDDDAVPDLESMAPAQIVFLEFLTSPFLALRQISCSCLWMARKFPVRRVPPVLQVFIVPAMY
jgi:hypothetical protein